MFLGTLGGNLLENMLGKGAIKKTHIEKKSRKVTSWGQRVTSTSKGKLEMHGILMRP